MQGETTKTRYIVSLMTMIAGRTTHTLPSIHTDVSQKLLLKDLECVWRWYPLGLQLGVPEADLRMIENTYKRTEDKKLHMLSEWQRINEQPSWSKLVRALVAVNERHVARTIAVKYGILYLVFLLHSIYMYSNYRHTLSI